MSDTEIKRRKAICEAAHVDEIDTEMHACDLISRHVAIDAIHGRIFQEIVVEYPLYNTYPEYKGKPYFSIKYTENGQEFIGYGTYKPEVLSEYLKEYFMPPAQPEPCEDAISRQAVYDALMAEPLKWDDSSIWESARCHQWMMDMDVIKAMSPAQPEQRWIPVTERLPKPYEYCLWTTTDGRVIYHHCDGLFSNYTAWMPLPEPYRAERREE